MVKCELYTEKAMEEQLGGKHEKGADTQHKQGSGREIIQWEDGTCPLLAGARNGAQAESHRISLHRRIYHRESEVCLKYSKP